MTCIFYEFLLNLHIQAEARPREGTFQVLFSSILSLGQFAPRGSEYFVSETLTNSSLNSVAQLC